MKKLAIFLIIFVIAGLIGCSKTIDRRVKDLTAQNEMLKNMRREDSIMHLQELNMLKEQYEKEIERLKANPELLRQVKEYSVVVGSFKETMNATNFSIEMKEQGYEGAIIMGPDDFSLVTYGTFSNLRDAIQAYQYAKDKIISTAWIYIKK